MKCRYCNHITETFKDLKVHSQGLHSNEYRQVQQWLYPQRETVKTYEILATEGLRGYKETLHLN